MFSISTKKIIMSNKKDLFKITVFMLLANVITQGIPTLIKVLSDKVGEFSIKYVLCISLFVIILGFLEYLSNILADKYYFIYTNNIGNQLLEKLLKAVLRLKSSQLREYNPDNLLRIATDDIVQMKNSIVKEFFISISTIISVIILFIFVVNLDYKLAAITFVWYIGYYYISNKIISSISKKRSIERQNYTDVVSYSKDIIYGTNDFKYFANFNSLFNNIKNTNNKYNESNVKLMVTSSMARYLTYIGSFTNIAIILLYKYFFATDITTGVILAMYMYTGKYADVFENFLYLRTLVKDNRALIKPYNDLLDASFNNGIELNSNINAITLKNLNISYSGKDIVTDMNYSFLKGKIYVISGESGKGKTSILNSIVNEIDFKGAVYINDKNIDEYSRESISSKVAYLNQNVYLINGTIKENIYLFNKENENDKKIFDNLGFSDLDYYLGNSEIDKISGGERKRIEFSRLLRCIREKDVILIDETFANLDKENASKIASYILNHKDQKIIVIVTHDDYIKNLFRTDQTEYVNI